MIKVIKKRLESDWSRIPLLGFCDALGVQVECEPRNLDEVIQGFQLISNFGSIQLLQNASILLGRRKFNFCSVQRCWKFCIF